VLASLRSRIVVILIAAVVPAAILVCIFAFRSFSQARDLQIGSLERQADFLLARILAVPAQARTTSSAIASYGIFGISPKNECEGAASDMLAAYPMYSGFALIESGTPRCVFAKPGAPPLADIVAEVAKGGAVTEPIARFIELAGERTVLFALGPGQTRDGRRVQAMLVLDNSYLADILGEFQSMPSSVAAIVDAGGRRVIAPPKAIDRSLWPADPLPVQSGVRTVSARSSGGDAFVYTIDKLPDQPLWVVTSQKEADVLGWPVRQLVVTALAPMIMIGAAVLAIWIGLHSTVLRWVGALRNATRAYSAGALTSRVGDASAAPREFAELAASFDALADRISERTLDLEREVASKTSYIREIHHRVKNNLQVIGSLLALQKRELPVDQRMILRFPEDRVNAMSAAYRASYAVSEIGQVPIGTVLREVAHRLQSSGDSRHVSYSLKFHGGELEVDLDTAVSIAMLMAEILPAYTDAAERTGHTIEIDLQASLDSLVVVVRGPVGKERQAFSLGRRFIQAYLRQLDASIDESVSGETRIAGPFPTPAKRHAEKAALSAGS
jgi:two-component sensor histidine kinase